MKKIEFKKDFEKLKESKVMRRAAHLKDVTVIEKLLDIIEKDFKLIVRSKSSALIVILGPLLLVLLIGAAFNTANIYGIKIGAYSSSYSPLTESLLEQLSDKQFTVLKTESEEECISKLRNGEFHVCTIFPANLEVGSEGSVVFHVDPSRMNLVYIIIDTISQKVSMKSEELSLQLTKTILDALENTKKEISEKQSLVTSLSTSTTETSTKVTSIGDALTNLDLGFNMTDVDFDDVYEELNDTEQFYNTTFSDLKDEIESLESQVKNFGKKLTSAATTRDTAMSNLASIEEMLSSNSKNIQSIDASMNKIKESIAGITVTSAEKIVSPIDMKIEPVVVKKSHLGFMFPTLIVLVIMFISVLLASTMIIREKTSAAYFRNIITPTKDWLFIAGAFLTNIFIIALQLIVIFIVASFFFKGQLWSIFAQLLLILFLIASIFILIGMLIGYAFKSNETGTLAAVSVSSALLFFSNTVLPIETLPSFVKRIADFNPFVLSEFVLRKLLLFEVGLKTMANSLYALIGFVVVLAAVVFVMEKVSRKSLA